MKNIRYEVYEDNGGGVHMFVLDGERTVGAYTNLEYPWTGKATVRDMIEQLNADPDAWMLWEPSDLPEGIDSADDLRSEIEESDEMVAWGCAGGIINLDRHAMGHNARVLLGAQLEYVVALVGGDRDGETLAEFDDEADAIRYAQAYYAKHDGEFDPVCGGVGVFCDGEVVEF